MSARGDVVARTSLGVTMPLRVRSATELLPVAGKCDDDGESVDAPGSFRASTDSPSSRSMV